FNLMDIVQVQYYSLEAGGSLLAFSAIAIAMLIVYNMNFKVYDEKFRQQFVFTDQSALKLVVGKLLWSIMQNIDVFFGSYRLEYVQKRVEQILNDESKEKTKMFKKQKKKSGIKEVGGKDTDKSKYSPSSDKETTSFGQAVSSDDSFIEKEIERTINQKLESLNDYLDLDELDIKLTPEQVENFKENVVKKLGFDLASEIIRVFKKKIKHIEFEKVVQSDNRVVGHIEVAEFGIMNLRDTNLDLIQLGGYLRSLLNKAMDEIKDNFGNIFLKRIIVNLYDKFSWEERELIHTFLLFDRESEFNLQHYRDDQLSTDGLRAFLKQIPVFADFADDEILALINKFAEENYPADSEVIKIGELCSRFYIILKGRVQVQQEESHELTHDKVLGKHAESNMINIAFLRRGDFFGEQSLLANSPNSSTIVTIEPTTLLSLDKSDFELFATQFRMVQQKLNVAFEFVELLEEMEVFRELSSQRVREISVRMIPRSYAKGDVIINEGEEGDAFYVIKKGIVDVFKQFDTDDEQILSEMKRGEYFGEIAMLKKSKRTATVVAKTKVELLRLDKVDFDELLGEYLSPNSVLQRTVWRRSADTEAKTTIMKPNDDMLK
ncbi:MAG: cyclic nucleotide-binding domain-containing protein, partial [Planctomycetes bacterium]|nr:cyclic nucleotide-binding domain-containing protein [Planctomycetota bacterium]